MMLDSKAALLDPQDRSEMLALLPDKLGACLELGAGIGRFTRDLAAKADIVFAVDFMESAINENRRLNGAAGNIQFLTEDVTRLELDVQFDVVFSNWLLMYLSDEAVVQLFAKVLRWLPENGLFVFRESCFHRSGDRKVARSGDPTETPFTSPVENPTVYRSPAAYRGLLAQAQSEETLADGQQQISRLEIVDSRNSATYVKHKKNCNQMVWLCRKSVSNVGDDVGESSRSFQAYLDLNQYTRQGILRYERIFGDGYVSTGGADTTRSFVERLGLQAGQRVLDVGCGIGGGDIYMAEEFGVEVLGVDLSTNMIDLALERSSGLTSLVQYRVCDVTTTPFPAGSFDVIYSRDCILHIQDKAALFESFFTWLRPGGQLLITDYCTSPDETSSEYREYVAQRGYHLLSVEEYGEVIRGAGFSHVEAVDSTAQFVESLEAELARSEEGKEAFVRDFCEEDYTYIVEGWQRKLVRCAQGDQKWGFFHATK